ncbi:MAG: methionyl-tRNA formyltransferase [Bacilli bacterium]|nr:methionyl-tRNA formyltransferase [Bacilli bacterium]
MGRYDKETARIVYMGTPAISATVLSGLLEQGFHVVGVICNPDKPTGRKGMLTPCPVKTVALQAGIPVFQPAKIRLDHGFLPSLEPDVIVTMAYGQIVPQEVLDCPKRGCINLHGSILPALRGAAPIQRALDLGLKETGVTLMQMVAAMDAGEAYDVEKVEIAEEDNYTSLAEKIGIAARNLIVRDLIPYLNGELPGVPQDESLVTFASKITPGDEKLDFHMSGKVFVNRVRALSLTPGGYAYLDGLKFKILSATPTDLPVGQPGEVVKAKKGLFVSVSDATLRLDLVQLEGKKMVDGASFANGYRDLLGKILS